MVFVFCTLSQVLYICSSKYLEWFSTYRAVHGRNGYVQPSKGNNFKSRQTKVTVNVFCTLSHSASHLCEVWWKYLKPFWTYRADMNTRQNWLCSMFNDSKSRQIRVKVHVFCMSSLSALHLCKVLWKYLWWYQSYGADTNDGSDAGRMDKIPLCVEN